MILQQGCDIRPSVKLQMCSNVTIHIVMLIPVLCDPANITFHSNSSKRCADSCNDVILQQKTINGRRDLTDAGDIDPDGTSH
jgi:hypothetical protein